MLNVGDNALSGLVIRNCPELVVVIYSHNLGLKKGGSVIIENCPKLDTEFSYKSDENKLPTEVTPEEQARIEEELRRQRQLLQDEDDEPEDEEQFIPAENYETILAFINNPNAT